MILTSNSFTPRVDQIRKGAISSAVDHKFLILGFLGSNPSKRLGLVFLIKEGVIGNTSHRRAALFVSSKAAHSRTPMSSFARSCSSLPSWAKNSSKVSVIAFWALKRSGVEYWITLMPRLRSSEAESLGRFLSCNSAQKSWAESTIFEGGQPLASLFGGSSALHQQSGWPHKANSTTCGFIQE